MIIHLFPREIPCRGRQWQKPRKKKKMKVKKGGPDDWATTLVVSRARDEIEHGDSGA